VCSGQKEYAECFSGDILMKLMTSVKMAVIHQAVGVDLEALVLPGHTRRVLVRVQRLAGLRVVNDNGPEFLYRNVRPADAAYRQNRLRSCLRGKDT
jgi:hypothetical protein